MIVKICFLAEGLIRDAESNSMSAFNIVEGITPAGLPLFVQKLAFFVLWEREPAEPERVEGQFHVLMGEERLSAANVVVEFAGLRRSRSIVYVNGLVIPRPGTIIFRIDLAGGGRGEYGIEIEPPPVVANQARVGL
ncbi:MAG TPA: hypothetical protein VGZ48_06690 [Candidatus Acidoferrales bacterium]|jgi:hypothetical protein|nr:hypothetical protein [Candidatus Acidoferrales bacterium]